MLAFIDIVQFKSICSRWKRAAELYTSSPSYTPLPEAPWLLVPPDHQQEQTNDNDVDHYFSFFSLSEKKFYKIKTSFEGFDSPSLKCVGSSHGWLAICNCNNVMAYLLNPLSGSKIDLPSIFTLPYNINELCKLRVHQVVSSSDPSRSRNFVVVVRYNTFDDHKHIHLAFCKKGNERRRNLRSHQSCVCVTFHKSHLYSLGKETLEVYDFGGIFPMLTMDFGHERSIPFRLLKSCVIMVDSPGEHYFLVNPAKEWEKVENLNDQAIFYNQELSHDQALGVTLLSTRNLPQLEGNSVYFSQLQNCGFDAHTKIPKYEVGGLLFSLESKVIKEY